MKSKLEQSFVINITAATIIKSLFIGLIAYVLFLIRDIILVVLTAVIIASAVEPAVRFLKKYKFPRVVSVLSVYLLSALVIVFIFYTFLPELIGDIKSLVSTIPSYLDAISNSSRIGDFPIFSDTLQSIGQNFSQTDAIQGITGSVSGATVGFLTTASAFFGGLLSFILIVVLSFYLAVQENGVTNFLKIITPIKHEAYALDLWSRAQTKIGLWMQGQLVLALVVGLLIYPVLVIFGVENAMFLALIAMVFELIPIFGSILAAIPAVGFATLQGGVSLGLLVAGWYLIVQQFENHIFHPLVVKKIVGIPAIVAILALVIGAKLAGFLGMIIAVPVATIFMELLNDYEKSKVREMKAEEKAAE